jgi:hypothetical protein
LNVNCLDGWIQRRDQFTWLFCSPDLMPLYFSLGVHGRPGLQPKSKYAGWTQSMNHCSCSTFYKGHVTVHVRSATGGARCEIFHT